MTCGNREGINELMTANDDLFETTRYTRAEKSLLKWLPRPFSELPTLSGCPVVVTTNTPFHSPSLSLSPFSSSLHEPSE